MQRMQDRGVLLRGMPSSTVAAAQAHVQDGAKVSKRSAKARILKKKARLNDKKKVKKMGEAMANEIHAHALNQKIDDLRS